MYFPLCLNQILFLPQHSGSSGANIHEFSCFQESHTASRDSNTRGRQKVPSIFLTVSQTMYTTLSLFLEIRIAKYFSVTKLRALHILKAKPSLPQKKKGGGQFFSPNRLINRKKGTCIFTKIAIDQIQNLSKTIGGSFHALFWFDILTQHLCLRIFRGFRLKTSEISIVSSLGTLLLHMKSFGSDRRLWWCTVVVFFF